MRLQCPLNPGNVGVPTNYVSLGSFYDSDFVGVPTLDGF
ncbi:hypothetical protein LEP1GSC040_1549 [Leptospira santarosai str. 2000030832]|nr:hypothetical protein LEP1GSC040_1549 [Leptospira santarosai str. 2000030832]